jgi:hypothetical protein
LLPVGPGARTGTGEGSREDTMLTFRNYVTESTGVKTVAMIGLTAKIVALNRQVQQDRLATNAEKNLSSQNVWMAALIALTGTQKS